jgi:hypothetical protein
MPGRFLIAVTGRNMSSVGAIYGYGVVQSTLAHSRARCFSAWKKIDIKKPLDALLGIFHLMTRTPFADTEPDWALEAGSMEVARARLACVGAGGDRLAEELDHAPMCWIPSHLLPPGRRC